MKPRIRTGFLAAGAAALLSSQAVYAAPTVTASAIDPLVSLSALAGAASRAAVCAGSTAATAATSAAAQAAPAPGCVLPVNAAPPPPPVSAPPPVMPVASGPGIGTLPLLLGLAAIAGIAALLLLNDDDDNGDATPVSPA